MVCAGSRSPSPGGLRRASSPGARVGVVGGMGSPSRPVTAAAYERFGVSDQRVLDEAVGAVGRAGAAVGCWVLMPAVQCVLRPPLCRTSYPFQCPFTHAQHCSRANTLI